MREHPVKKHGYHHGDLGSAALSEALVVMAERGARGVTFAEVARRLGVSAAALYRHYAHPQALLAAVAAESFVLFEGALRSVGASDPYERLRAMANAYLAFALKHPARYELMFGLRFEEEKPDALQKAGDASFGALLEALAACRPDASVVGVRALGKQVWALSHGFAALSGVHRMALGKRQAQSLLWAAIRLIVEGAGSDSHET
jgi:AcrR family transcriptional regulator